MKIHAIGQEEYKEQYFRNFIDIEDYRDRNTFYKKYLNE